MTTTPSEAKNTYTLTMLDGKERKIKAWNMTIDSGHYVFWQRFQGPTQTVAMSQVLELSTEQPTT